MSAINGVRPVLYDHTGRPINTDRAGPDRDGFALPHVFTFSSIVKGGYDTYLHGRFDEAIRHAREEALEMRRDCFLMGLLQERKLAVASLRWHLAIDDEYDREQVAVKEHLTKVIRATPRLYRVIWSLLEAIWYGRYGVQIKWAWKEIDGHRSLTVARHLPVNGDKIGHKLREGRGSDLHVPYVQVHGGETDALGPDAELEYGTEGRILVLSGTWRERLLIHQHEIDDADYLDAEAAEGIHGVGIRHRCFFLNWMRREYVSWLADFLERVGMGLTVFYYDASNPKSKEEATRAAHEQSRRSSLIWPSFPDSPHKGGSVQRVETPTNGAAVLLQLQQHLEDVIERYVVGQSLSSGTEGSGLGGSGVAMLHAATKANIARWDAGNLAETLTVDLVDVVKRYTHPDADFPVRFEFAVEEPNPESKIGLAAQIVNLGGMVKKSELLSSAGFSEPEPDDDVVSLQEIQRLSMPQQVPGAEGMPPDGGGDGGQPPPDQGGGDPYAALAQQLGEGDEDFDGLFKGQPQGEQVSPYAREDHPHRVAVSGAADSVHPAPSPAQSEAGNFPHGHFRWHGLEIALEVAKGGTRRKTGPDGKVWERRMKAHYGHVRRTSRYTADGDGLDVYVGPRPESELVVVVEQLKPGGGFDEHKTVIGCLNREEALDLYRAHYPPGWDRVGKVRAMSVEEFKEWAFSPKAKRPFARDGSPQRYAAIKGPLVSVQHHGHFAADHELPNPAHNEMELNPEWAGDIHPNLMATHPLTDRALRRGAIGAAALALAHGQHHATMAHSAPPHWQPGQHAPNEVAHGAVFAADPQGRVAAFRSQITHLPYDPPDQPRRGSVHSSAVPFEMQGFFPDLAEPGVTLDSARATARHYVQHAVAGNRLHAQVQFHPDPEFRALLKDAVMGNDHGRDALADWLEEREHPAHAAVRASPAGPELAAALLDAGALAEPLTDTPGATP